MASRKKPSLAPVPSASQFGVEGMVWRGPGAVAKYSPSGKLIGWYAEGQTAGRPDTMMPLQRHLHELKTQYRRQLAPIAKIVSAQAAGKASGLARQETRDLIRLIAVDVIAADTPKREINREVARVLLKYLRLKKSTREIAKARAKRP